MTLTLWEIEDFFSLIHIQTILIIESLHPWCWCKGKVWTCSKGHLKKQVRAEGLERSHGGYPIERVANDACSPRISVSSTKKGKLPPPLSFIFLIIIKTKTNQTTENHSFSLRAQANRCNFVLSQGRWAWETAWGWELGGTSAIICLDLVRFSFCVTRYSTNGETP